MRLLRALTKPGHRELASAYVQAFKGPVGERALTDLADYCCAFRTTYAKDEKVMHMLEGRREVFNRIAAMMKLDVEDYGRLMGSLVRQAKGGDDE